MSDISKINVNGVDYDVKDTIARTEVTPIERGGTGSTVKEKAIESLFYGGNIGSNNLVDLNALKSTAYYKITFSSSEAYTYNSPRSYGVLIVFCANTYIVQIMIDYTNLTYTRISTDAGNNWSPWKTLTGTTS